MSAHIRTIELTTGVSLPYVEQGDPDGIPVVLVHGYSDSHLSYGLLLPHLPASIHAYAYTQRGHGDAEKPVGRYRMEDSVADLSAFMDALGLESAVVVGHSAGSYVAQHFALEHPERTRGLVLIGAFRAFGGNPDVMELHEAVSEFADAVDPGFAREFQESCVAQPVPAEFIDAAVANSCKMPARVWRAYLDGMIAAGVPTEEGTVTAPTLILWGDNDAFCPRGDQDGLLAAIPQSRLEIYEGTGHCPHWEQPERAAAEIAEFAAVAAGSRDVAAGGAA